MVWILPALLPLHETGRMQLGGVLGQVYAWHAPPDWIPQRLKIRAACAYVQTRPTPPRRPGECCTSLIYFVGNNLLHKLAGPSTPWKRAGDA